MRFKTDENLPEEVAELFRENGYDCPTAVSQQLAGQPDGAISAVCSREERILVTLDVGFANIRAYPPAAFPGFIVFRLGKQDTPHLLAVAARLIAALRDAPIQHELWIVEEANIRRRR
ncbi:MAG TPA: DUF5615 family PIN-like protein [Thermoanaerobaculia bacterium]|jgi:predicted nuclease of predicted toxin-antitoxin system|nr:DUF5615 family PIN-like protein [Thermoanaerobaculia bacterium]